MDALFVQGELLEHHLFVGRSLGSRLAIGYTVITGDHDVDIWAMFKQEVSSLDELRESAIGLHASSRIGHDLLVPREIDLVIGIFWGGFGED